MATRGREFPNSKSAGRNASEPIRSLVNELEKPTLWSEGEGRCFDYHALRGKPKRYSVHVNGPYCITFEWEGEDAVRVNLENYH